MGFSGYDKCLDNKRQEKVMDHCRGGLVKSVPVLEDGSFVRLMCGRDKNLEFERGSLRVSSAKIQKNTGIADGVIIKPPARDFIIRTRNKKKNIYILSVFDTFGDELFMSVDYSSDNPLKKDIIFKKSRCPEKDNSLKIKFVDRFGKKIFKFFDGSFMCCDEKMVFASSVLKKSICEVSIV